MEISERAFRAYSSEFSNFGEVGNFVIFKLKFNFSVVYLNVRNIVEMPKLIEK